jgi:hypothetical protein
MGGINTVPEGTRKDVAHVLSQMMHVPCRALLNTAVNLREICQRDEKLLVWGGGGRT